MVNERTRWRSHPRGAVFREWMASDGVTLRRMDWPPRKGARPRGSLLFAGGRGDFIEKYLESLAHWRDRGWRVTAFDWRGQGGSGGDMESFDVMSDDFAVLIADVAAAAPGPHVAVAHSMGGHVLLKAIVERRPALDAAVLVAPMIMVNSAPIPSWLAPDLADTMCRLGLRERPMWKRPAALARPGSQRQRILTGSRERYEDELWWWKEAPEFNVGAPSWGWLCAAFRSAAASFTRERLAKVDLPILILATDRDRLVSTPAIRRVAAMLPRAELALVPGAAHEILRETDPIRAGALARIDLFLARHAP